MAQTLTEFLLARIAEDEAEANAADGTPTPIGMWDDERVLAECEAKRRIACRYVDNHPSATDPYDLALLDAMRDLASVYADHPDYRQEWKP